MNDNARWSSKTMVVMFDFSPSSQLYVSSPAITIVAKAGACETIIGDIRIQELSRRYEFNDSNNPVSKCVYLPFTKNVILVAACWFPFPCYTIIK